ncbi:hypothetical protein HPB52_014476 [Rhipicephalus sanguineus]|uniref:Endonuclease/exonuclease/phosphatase domain-containing protein n=1 Tax=Rhipicephalus sanguineus TaxID=34632 RepID=A0A9D4T5Q7_RHISA|nr:hypothetical protein HPB52_014476 [Rhipicephalus sanguineus]
MHLDPDVIALQETEAEDFKVSGYLTHVSDGKKRTAILTKKTINAQQHCIHHRIEHTLVEIVPEKKHQQSLFVLNVYSPPKDHLKDLDKLMREVKKLSKGNGLIVVGDFNAPHVAWGYTASKKKGEDMHNVAKHHHLTLLNDPQTPMRIGNSVSRNTSPDLTFVKGLKHYEWSCMDENLGSDHFIAETITPHHKSATKIGKAKITDWQAFRKDESAVDATIDDIEMWTRRVVERAEKHTRVIQLSRDTPVVDPHLLHLWEARRGLARRWQRHKWNRKLKVRISKLVEEAQEYSEQLERKNWHNTCNKLQGTLSTKRTWAILKTLLAKKETKSAAKQKVHRLIHNHPGEAQDIIKEVKEKFLDR